MSRWVWRHIKQRQPAAAKALSKLMLQDQLEANTAGGLSQRARRKPWENKGEKEQERGKIAGVCVCVRGRETDRQMDTQGTEGFV